MESPTSFDLNRVIQQWRETLAQSLSFRDENLDELESHLRDSTDTLQARGLSAQEAFLIASKRLGKNKSLEAEFEKVNRQAIGNVPFMKTQRSLGILWLGLCSYNGVKLLWLLLTTFLAPNSKAPVIGNLLPMLICSVILAGAVASFLLLLRGVAWARMFVGFLSALVAVGIITQSVEFRSLSVLPGVYCIFALVSAVLLFLPRHEPVTQRTNRMHRTPR